MGKHPLPWSPDQESNIISADGKKIGKFPDNPEAANLTCRAVNRYASVTGTLLRFLARTDIGGPSEPISEPYCGQEEIDGKQEEA